MNSLSDKFEEAPSRIQYLRVILLGFGAFIFNTTEFVPVGLLTDIAQDFSISTASAGWMLTVYAWIVALMSLPLMIFTSKVDRKKLLLYSFAVFVVGHIISITAWSFAILLIGRICIALSHAVFWSITASIAIRVAPWGKKNFALSVLATGTGLAMVLGVPLGRLTGQLLGWRMTFVIIAISALILLLIMLRLLPSLPSLFSGTVSSITTLLKKPILLAMYLFLFLFFTAHYTAYSYIEPFLKIVGNSSSAFTTMILLLFGAAGILGSLLFGFFGEKANKEFLLGSSIIVTLSLLLLFNCVQNTGSMIALTIFWGASLMVVGLAIQVRVFNVDAKASDIIMSLFSGIINFGIGTGALFGNQVIQHINLTGIGFVGALFSIIAIAVLVFIIRAQTRTEQQTPSIN